MKTEPTEALRAMANDLKYNLGVLHSNPQLILEESFISGIKYGQSSPKIKQLEWKYDDKFFIWEAGSVFGKYSFVDNSLIVNKKLFFRGKEIAIVLTIDEAKAAAQRDFEKRVKECLE